MAGSSPAKATRGRLARLSLGRDAGPDRAGDAGAAESAIAERVLRQILLVVILGEIEWRRLADFGGDAAKPGALEARFVAFARRLGGPLLLGGIGVDRRAVLRPDIVALAHPLGRVVALPEDFE